MPNNLVLTLSAVHFYPHFVPFPSIQQSTCESFQCQVDAGCSGTAISHSRAVSTSECIANCFADESCMWWTYQEDSSNCFLYEDCAQFFGCDSCTSGQSDCGKDLIASKCMQPSSFFPKSVRNCYSCFPIFQKPCSSSVGTVAAPILIPLKL